MPPKNKTPIASQDKEPFEVDEQTLDAVIADNEDGQWLPFLASCFYDEVESVLGVDQVESESERARNVQIDLSHAEILALAKRDLDSAQIIIAHHLGMILNKYCPERKEGRPSKTKPSGDRTVLVNGQEVNFDELLRKTESDKRGREWRLRKAGNRSTDQLNTWLDDQIAKKKKPTLNAWLKHIDEMRGADRKEQIREAYRKADKEMRSNGELGGLKKWARLENCKFQDLEKKLTIPPLDAIITDPPYNQESVDAYLFAYLAEFAGKHLKAGAPLVVMVGHCYLPRIIEQIEGHGFWLRWSMVVTYKAGECHISERQVNSKSKLILVCHRQSERDSKRKFRSLRTDWIEAGPQTDQDDAFHDWQQEPETFESLLNLFCEPDWLVCDPCAGWATTAIATLRQKMKFIGCEVLEDRFDDGWGMVELEWQKIRGGRNNEKWQTELPPSVKPKTA